MKYLIKFTTIPKNKYDHPINRETTIDCENALIAKIVFEKNFGAVGKRNTVTSIEQIKEDTVEKVSE